MKTIKLEEALNRIANSSPYYQYKYSSNESKKDEFLIKKQSRYALFLGAGASVESEVLSAEGMIKYFATAICKIGECRGIFNDNHENRLEWLRKRGYYKGDDDLYSSLFEKSFPKRYERRDFIEKQVEGKIPSLGYIALAHLLKKQTFDTIITTNFDDLIYIACTHFTDIRPVVFSLGGFATEIASVVNGPRVLKIHGDYLFQDLKNTEAELSDQDQTWSNKSKKLSIIIKV